MEHPWSDAIWQNGHVLDRSAARVDVTDRGFALGDGLFETMLWTGQAIRFFDDHLARLSHGAASLGLTVPLPPTQIEAGLSAFAALAEGRTAVVRLTLTRGVGPRGLSIEGARAPSLTATLAPLPETCHPVSLKTGSIPRNAGAPSARFKTLSYIDNVAALMEAKQAGSDDAIMLGAEGRVACTSSANLILIVDGKCLTPPVEDGALPGIVRGRLVRAGLTSVAPITRALLGVATCAYLTNAVVGVRPVLSIDGRALTLDEAVRARLIDALNK